MLLCCGHNQYLLSKNNFLLECDCDTNISHILLFENLQADFPQCLQATNGLVFIMLVCSFPPTVSTAHLF